MPRRKATPTKTLKNDTTTVTCNLRLPLDTLALLMPKCRVKLTRCDAHAPREVTKVRVKREVEEQKTTVEENYYWSDNCGPVHVKVETADVKQFGKPCIVKLEKLEKLDYPIQKQEQKHVPVKVESKALRPCVVLLYRYDLEQLKQIKLKRKPEVKPRRSFPIIKLKKLEDSRNHPPVRKRKTESLLKVKLETPDLKKPDEPMCFLCGKKFTKKEHMETHLRRHLGEKAYKCDVCSKSFVTKAELQMHSRSHTGERPIKCTCCDKSFSYRTSLQHHMRSHADVKPYICKFCHKLFNNWKSLKICSTPEGEQSFACRPCRRSIKL